MTSVTVDENQVAVVEVERQGISVVQVTIPGPQGPSGEGVGETKRFAFFSGQSNFVNAPTGSWSPSSRALIWNNTVGSNSTGTAFIPLTSSTINFPQVVISELAASDPKMTWYGCNASWGGQTLDHWLVGTSAPDVYAEITNNLGPAMTAAGVSKIDIFFWWQGESGYSLGTGSYKTGFNTFLQRLIDDGYIDRNTRIVICGLTSYDNAVGLWGTTVARGWENFSILMQDIVNDMADRATYFAPGDLEPKETYWDAASSYIHMNAAGYLAAGKLCAQQILEGIGYAVAPGIQFNRRKNWLGIGAQVQQGTQGRATPLAALDVCTDYADKGIVGRFYNSGVGADAGALLQVTEAANNSIGWAFGKQPGSNNFGIYYSRYNLADGTLLLSITNAGAVTLGDASLASTALGISAGDPTRGIIAVYSNLTNPATAGCMTNWSAAGVGNVAFGIGPSGDFALYNGRTPSADGTQWISMAPSAGLPYFSFGLGTLALSHYSSGVPKSVNVFATSGAGYNAASFSTSEAAELQFFRSRDAIGTKSTLLSVGDVLGRIRFWGAGGTNYKEGANIWAEVLTGIGAGNDIPTALVLATSADGSATPAERLRISSGVCKFESNAILVAWILFGTVTGVNQAIFSTYSGGATIGAYWRVVSGGTPGWAATGMAAEKFGTTGSAPASVWKRIAVFVDEANAIGWHSVNGIKTDFDSTIASPSASSASIEPIIGAWGNLAQILQNGGRLASFFAWPGTQISKAQDGAMFNIERARFGV